MLKHVVMFKFKKSASELRYSRNGEGLGELPDIISEIMEYPGRQGCVALGEVLRFRAGIGI